MVIKFGILYLFSLISDNGKIRYLKKIYKNEFLNDIIYEHLLIKMQGLYYYAVDRESLSILHPFFELWMYKNLVLKKNDVFVDIGSHVGKYTIPIARKIGVNGRVISIEASPVNYSNLKIGLTINELNNVGLYNIAAWSKPEVLNLYFSENAGQNTVKKQDNKICSYQVQGFPIDLIIEREGVTKIDYIKIDVEGAELETLFGLRKSISTYKPIIIIEIMPENLKKVLPFLNKLNYCYENIGSDGDFAYNFKAFPRSS